MNAIETVATGAGLFFLMFLVKAFGG